jgi:predicted ATPase
LEEAPASARTAKAPILDRLNGNSYNSRGSSFGKRARRTLAMKITLKNFGPLREFHFDTRKDLHLIVGENNVGKSYAITLVYLILKNLLTSDDLTGSVRFASAETTEDADTDLANLGLYGEIDISAKVIPPLTELINDFFVDSLNASLVGTFETPAHAQNIHVSEPFSIILDTRLVTACLTLDGDTITLSQVILRKPPFLRKLRQHRGSRDDADRYLFYIHEDDSPEEQASAIQAAALTYHRAFIADALRHIRSVYFLPASRSGLYQALNAFGQIVAELSKSRAFVSRRIELPGISEPLSDYFLRLSEISTSQGPPSAYRDIAEFIEAKILSGQVDFDPRSKKLTYQPKHARFRLDLSATSSMVSELAPIVSFLRYVIPDEKGIVARRRRSRFPNSKPFIVLEEPEAHIHPKVQVLLAQTFSQLLRAGAKLAITTHSNYLFNALSNLVISGDIESEQSRAIKMSASDQGSTALELKVDSLGIEDLNFGEISESLLDQRLESIEKRNESLRSD